MTLTQKEASYINDLKAQEKICIEKYTKYAADAHDTQLKNLFSQIGNMEQQHLMTLDQIASGTVPQSSSGSNSSQQMPTFQMSGCTEPEKQFDAYLCSDLLSTEKYTSSEYNTSIFEFTDIGVRNALNHIQKEEQEHGQLLYSYMAVNGMYS
jgi:rubrerythrin